METYLRHGVHMCLVDEGAIFLDLPANAYLGIDAETKSALTTCLVGLNAQTGSRSGQAAGLPDPVAALLRRGLLTHAKSLGRSFSPLNVSMTHAVPFGTGRPHVRIRVIHLALFLAALLRASILIRRGRLFQWTTNLMILKGRIHSTPRATDLQTAVAIVHIARRLSTLFYTSKDACLLDSMVLTEFLTRQGHCPTLVLGVRTKPFLAHAWVQLGTHVLNDSLEHAQTLTPIAAI